jgi:hypothetical protein
LTNNATQRYFELGFQIATSHKPSNHCCSNSKQLLESKSWNDSTVPIGWYCSYILCKVFQSALLSHKLARQSHCKITDVNHFWTSPYPSCFFFPFRKN